MSGVRRIAVVGGGVTGLAAAWEAVHHDDVEVVLFEAAGRIGGRIDSGPFAGLDSIDSGADAFLARVPDARRLAEEVGLGGDLVSPEPVHAAVWYDGLHRIPEGLLLGVPGRVGPLARTRLLSWRGKTRAALEPLLPRTSLDDDSVGALVRARFGDEVHERLVDALVGSIYAADTDRFSLREVPQLFELASSSRSLLLGARRRAGAGTATAATAGPVFAAPRGGLPALTEATALAITSAGGSIHTGTAVDRLARRAGAWHVGDERFDDVILALPAHSAARLVGEVAPPASGLLARAETADVAMITMHVPAGQWPARLRGLSGYLVPKPVQRSVTAASFGSQKWAHWRPPAGGEVLRVSIGRDGLSPLDRSDDELSAEALNDLAHHLEVRFHPIEQRVTRWPAAFAQYRPLHREWVRDVERSLPAGLHVAGSSYRGIGIPACVRDGRAVARTILTGQAGLPD